ncbi:hypothetical protein MMC14_001998 [Varicellaria rhodocarpa]|nr:hypothetical protein [Varicellaria rhodocarpa]
MEAIVRNGEFVAEWSHCCETDHELKAGVHYSPPHKGTEEEEDDDDDDDDHDGDDANASRSYGDNSKSGDSNSASGSFEWGHQDEGTSRDSGSGLDVGSASNCTREWQSYTHKCESSRDYKTAAKFRCDDLARSSPMPFTYVRKLGSGGHGEVYEVVSYGLFKQTFALKTIHRGQSSLGNTVAEAIFNNEVEILKSLRHPHIVELLHSYISGDHFNIIMRPVADGDLAHFMQSSERTSETDETEKANRCRILFQAMTCLASAVEYLHSRNTWHLDIKPKNILIKGNAVHLTDFGIAKRLGPVPRLLADDQTSSEITAMAPEYAAPETVEQNRVDSACDIFSLGCVFAEIVTFLAYGTGKALNDFKVFRTAGQKDCSFHRTIQKTKAWIKLLENDCKYGELSLSSYAIPFNTINQMISRDPEDRPTAHEVWLRFSQDGCCSGFDTGSADIFLSSTSPLRSSQWLEEQENRNAQDTRKQFQAVSSTHPHQIPTLPSSTTTNIPSCSTTTEHSQLELSSLLENNTSFQSRNFRRRQEQIVEGSTASPQQIFYCTWCDHEGFYRKGDWVRHERESHEHKGGRQLLRDVQGYVRPGKLTALMGVSGAGKTALSITFA